MSELKNILLFEQTPEALEAVRSGDAFISAGGIRRKGKGNCGFLEQAKPAVMSVADFQSLFEGKEHALETDEHLRMLDTGLALSAESLQEIERIEWLNNALFQQTYTMTYEGFRQTLRSIESIVKQVSSLEQYIRRRDAEEMAEKAQTFINYLRSDAGHMLSEKYSVVNGNISDHLDQISAFAQKLLNEIENTPVSDNFLQLQMLLGLMESFTYVVRRYSALYYYENDGKLMPGDYDEWIRTISAIRKSKKFQDTLTYYISLRTTLPFREKMRIGRKINDCISDMISNIRFEQAFIKSHSKKEYLTMDSQIRQKIEAHDYYVNGSNAIVF